MSRGRSSRRQKSSNTSSRFAPRRRPFICKQTRSRFEGLESRDLMAVVELTERFEWPSGSNLQAARGEFTSGVPSDSEWEILLPSAGDETVLLSFSSDIHIKEISSLDPEGTEESSWQLIPGMYNVLGTTHEWISGVIPSGEGIRRLHLRIDREHFEGWDPGTWIDAHFNVSWIDQSSLPTEPQLLEFHPSEEGEYSKASFAGVLRPNQKPPVIDGITQSWSLSHSENLAFLEPLSEENEAPNELHLKAPRVPDEMVEQFEGLWIGYESSTGRLQAKTDPRSPLAALEIRSDDPIFVGPTPTFTMPNPFNVYSPNKIFTFMDPSRGQSTFDFGPVLPTGLSRDELAAKLQVSGAYNRGGTFSTIVFSVDEDVPFEQALTTAFTPLTGDRFAVFAEARFDLSSGDHHRIDFKYRWNGTNIGALSSLQHAQLEYRYSSDGPWVSLLNLDPCQEVCSATQIIDGYSGPLYLRFANRSNDTMLAIESMQIESDKKPSPIKFSVDVKAGESLQVSSLGWPDIIRIFDHEGNRVIESNMDITLSGPVVGAERYFIDLYPAGSIVSLQASIQLSPNGISAQPYIVSGPGSFNIHFPGQRDERACDLSLFTWNGSAASEIYTTDFSIMYVFDHPHEDGVYTLHIPEHACRLLTGPWVKGGDYLIDFKAPALVSVPLRDQGILPLGMTSIAMDFDEPIGSITGGIWPTSLNWGNIRSLTGETYPLGIGRESIDSNRVVVPIGELPVGDYILELNELTVTDNNGNGGKIPAMSIPFKVSEEAAQSPTAAFDLDLNGTTDPRDFALLSSFVYGGQIKFLDLNHDELWDERDIDLWIEQSRLFPAGDVNFDGVFDATDFEICAYLQLDTPASRRSGDFDGDGFYTTADLTLAMQGGFSSPDEEV